MASGINGDWLQRQPEEFRLLVASTAGPNATARPREPVEWDAFRGLAERHGLASFAFRNLTDEDHSWLPPAVRAGMREDLKARTGHNLRMAAETLRICRAFADADVPHFVLKGAAVGETFYGNPGLRDAVDIDVLVPVQVAPRCLAIVQELGFLGGATRRWSPNLGRPRRFIAKDWLLQHTESGTLVELHWRLTENPYYLPMPPDLWRRAAEPRGEGFPHLPRLLWALFLVCHGAQSHFTQLKWLTDLHLMQAQFPDITPERLISEADARGLARPVRQALALLDLIYGTDLSPQVRRDVYRHGVLRYLVADALSALEAREALGGVRSLRHGAEVFRRWRYRLALSNGLRYRTFEIARPLWKWTGIS